MSYTTPAGAPRKPGENLSAQGKAGEPGSSAPKSPTSGHTPAANAGGSPAQPRRSAGAPKRPAGKGTGGSSKGKATGKGPKGRRVTPVKVASGRNWAAIATFTVVGLLVAAMIGYSGWQAVQGSKTWQERLIAVKDVVDFTKTNSKELAAGNGNHVQGRVEYFTTPSVGGNHHPRWQNCMGDVYAEQISSEHATHSLEHGAVWITYDPAKVPATDIAKLQGKVSGNEYMMMSPFPGQPSPVSVQAWGYQLQVTSAGDERIDEFIKSARVNASVEPGATCSGGVTATGVEPQPLPSQPAS